MGFALLLARRSGKWTGMSTPLTLESGQECPLPLVWRVCGKGPLTLSDSMRSVIAETLDNHSCGDGFVSAGVDEDE